MQCGVVRKEGSRFVPIQEAAACEIGLSELRFASADNTCDGRITGFYRGLLSGNQPLAGTFDTPLNVQESEVSSNACRPSGARCSSNADCCARSCSPVLGACN